MAATDPRRFERVRTGPARPRPRPAGAEAARERAGRPRRLHLLGPVDLAERVDEEVGRAIRHGTALCCLFVQLEDLDQIASSYGAELSERALKHAGEALSAELRRFDRVGRPQQDEIVVLLPGAAGPQGEAVARRALRRLRAIKIEAAGVRRPLCVSVGIAAWRSPWNGQQLIDEARAAAGPTRQGVEG